MSNWVVEDDPSDVWYQFRIYDGDEIVVNIPRRGDAGRHIADQIVREHNELAAAQARIKELTAALTDLVTHEWQREETMSGAMALFCPACHNPKEWTTEWTRLQHAAIDRPDGHRQGCWLAIAIEPIRKELALAAASTIQEAVSDE